MATKTSLVSKAPSGWLRWFLKMPIIFYRLKLGGLLGERFVLLNTIGRKSGQIRQTVVEVVGHDKTSDTYFVVSGWGYKAQWYQNLLAHPDIHVEVGWRRLEIHAEALPVAQAVKQLERYREQHPMAARELSRLMGLNLNSANSEELARIVETTLPMLALRPR